MISPSMAKLIGLLPSKWVSFLANRALNGYINKYANINVENYENLNNIPTPVIFISNHLSNSDGLILNKILKNFDVTFVAGVKLSDNAFTKLGIDVVKTTPVHPNSPDKEGLKKIISIIKGGNNVLIFPEGTRSRSGKMIKGKKGIILIAKMCKVPIIPIGITGTEKLLPINMEGKMELEKFHNADVNVKIGEMFYLPTKFQEESKKEYDERSMDIIMKNISKLLPDEYKGEYL
ncbi:lysophospholipid acyltransferase family protein [Clostridium botulinum]|uniref:Acyl-phosphate glycerol 3-phosphate acyltransferase n=1 Tax=Clostridium botulinum TaxID=1491 RepID=A0A9Q1V0F9_CLOBO|nr:lysophospholipid acyltransferase family protein [Clostridium botulinum]AEB75235.1 1-acyl-sn-glycerol-3-phosphate acyltransferase, putative [Clostridium botulinum BKT015925]KEI03307.1 acyl-phosphate glycerol 3-phosphate acyltransferase [Clostridium botulinum D str. 16868]KEI05383.1 acyl-phosphate glycerol 3-phosphate acyltransferase [Clostridium botulinum C/D str. Sp77]KLU75209.1 acyl-phosphate glycerol 3-phosphate acyltransferase [Clostridium botulinum V891]KOA73380.1 acyl-phosphate glycero